MFHCIHSVIVIECKVVIVCLIGVNISIFLYTRTQTLEHHTHTFVFVLRVVRLFIHLFNNFAIYFKPCTSLQTYSFVPDDDKRKLLDSMPVTDVNLIIV